MIAHSNDYPVPLHQSDGAWWFNLNVQVIPAEPGTENEPERPQSYRYDSVRLPGEPNRSAMISAGVAALYSPDAEIALQNARLLDQTGASWETYQAYRQEVKAQVTAAGYPGETEPATAVTMRQARLALAQAGLLAAVEDWVAQAEASVQIEWEYATEIRRDWPPVVEFSAAKGMTDEQVDDLFALARTF